MFCDHCGKQLEDGWKACPSCGKLFAPAASVTPPPARASGADHVKILGVLWIVWSVIHLGVSSAAGLWWLRMPGMRQIGHFSGPPHWIPYIGPLSGFCLLLSVVGIIAGVGLLGRASWARIVIIVFACLALLSFPVGTLLGAYTLWALLSTNTSRDFQPARRA